MTKPASQILRAFLVTTLYAFCTVALAQPPAPNNQSTAALAERVRSIGVRIDALLQSAEQVGGPGIAPLRDALEVRASALLDLIDTDPELALESQLPEETSDRIRAISAAFDAFIEKAGSWQGHLNVMVEDNFEQRKSRTLYHLLLADSSLDLHFAKGVPPATCAERTSVRGMRLGSKVAVASFQQSPAATATCGPAGIQNVAVIYAQYPSTSFGPGATLAFVQNTFFGTNTRSLNDFWLENSNGITAASGTVVGPVTLDSDYSSCDSNQILSAAIQAADSLIDFQNFQRIFVVVPSRSGCSFGIGLVGCGMVFSPSKGYLSGSWSVVTVDANPAPNSLLSFIAHEGGHNLGLNHSSSLDYGAIPLGPLGVVGVHDEYGDFFSAMGVSYTYNGTTLVGHYAAQQKLTLNWLSLGSSIQQVETDGTYLVEPYESANAGVKALRIRRGAGNNLWIWIEYRQPIGNYDPTLAPPSPNIYDGALIHYEDPNYLPDHTHLLDFHPSATPNDFSDAPLNIGSAWSDPYSPTSIHILGSSAMGLLVSIGYDSTVCSYSLSQGSPVAGAGGAGSVSVGTSSTCGWNAVTNAAWISITGGVIGAGPGTVSFSASPNNTGSARSGSITVGGQNISITQAAGPATPPEALSVSPSSGSGPSQTFVASYSAGGAPINLVYFLVNTGIITPLSCFVQYNPAANTYQLLNDAGTTLSAAVTAGSTGSASNSQCTISGAGGGSILSGSSLTVNFPITFNSAYAGAQNVFLFAYDSSGQNSGWQQLGTWTVPGTGGTLPAGAIAACGQNGAPCVASLTPANGSGLSGTFTGIFTDPGGAGAHALGYILFLPTPNIVWYTATGSCLVEYNRISDAMRLINDAGTDWLPGTVGIPLSQGGTLTNSHCTLDVTHSSASINGDIMTVTVKVTFNPNFTGQLATFLQAFDMAGNFTSMTQFGNWMAAPAPTRPPGPYVVGVSPTSGTGSSTTLSFTAGHTSGVPALAFVTMLISSVIAGGVPCQVFYFEGTNTLNLVNDGGTAMVSAGIVPGTAGTLANSRCSINTGGATETISGNNVTVSVPMTFNTTTFGGKQNVYVNAFDNYGFLSHWVTGGSWTVQ